MSIGEATCHLGALEPRAYLIGGDSFGLFGSLFGIWK